MKKNLLVFIFMVAVVLMISITVSAETAQNGEWLVEAKEDPLTDEFTLFISNPKDYNKGLILRRKEGTTELILSTDYLGSAGVNPDYSDYFKDLIYRFDKEDLVETKWSISSNGSALFFKEDKDTLKSFIAKMMAHNELVFGYWPYEKTRKTVVYNLSGFTVSITPYLDDLGWEDLK